MVHRAVILPDRRCTVAPLGIYACEPEALRGKGGVYGQGRKLARAESSIDQRGCWFHAHEAFRIKACSGSEQAAWDERSDGALCAETSPRVRLAASRLMPEAATGGRVCECERDDAAGLGRPRTPRRVPLHRQLEARLGHQQFSGFRRKRLRNAGVADVGAMRHLSEW